MLIRNPELEGYSIRKKYPDGAGCLTRRKDRHQDDLTLVRANLNQRFLTLDSPNHHFASQTENKCTALLLAAGHR